MCGSFQSSDNYFEQVLLSSWMTIPSDAPSVGNALVLNHHERYLSVEEDL